MLTAQRASAFTSINLKHLVFYFPAAVCGLAWPPYRRPAVLCSSLPANMAARPVFFSLFSCVAKLELVFQAVASTSRSLLGDSGLFLPPSLPSFFLVMILLLKLYNPHCRLRRPAGLSTPQQRGNIVFLFRSAQHLPLNVAT